MRKYFQSVKRKFDNSIVLFDNASTVQLPDVTIEALANFYYNDNFPANSASYRLSEQSMAKIAQCKAKILNFVDAGNNYEVVFCKNVSDFVNAIADFLDQEGDKMGDVLMTNLEHDSIYKTIDNLCMRKWCGPCPIDVLGWSNEKILEKCGNGYSFAFFTMRSNIIGQVWDDQFSDLQKCIAAIRERESFWFHREFMVALDACQIIGHKKINLAQLNPDFLFFSGHKLGGPQGLGVVLIDKQNSFLSELKRRFEAGSAPLAQIVALETTIDFYNQNVDFEAVEQHVETLASNLVAFLKSFEFVEFVLGRNGQPSSGGIISFIPKGFPLHDFSWVLAENGVLTRSGTMCAELACKSLKIDGCIRISLFDYNNQDDLEFFYKAFVKTVDFFKRTL